MRHGNKVKKLGRTHAHRQATLSSLSSALIVHKRITTTLAKAKALRGFVEPIINRAKDPSTANRRQAFRRLGDKEAVKALFGDVAGVLGERPGGYTRVVKLGHRLGDAAEMAIIELVDFNDVKPEGGSATRRKTRRSRRRTGAGDQAPKAEATPRTGAAKPAAKAADDLTKLFGIGEAFAAALDAAGIRTYTQLAKADLYTLRDAIQEGSKVSDEAANEETWAAQAAFAARGDWDGLEAYVERLKAGETPETEAAEPAGEPVAAAEPADEVEPAPAEEAPPATADEVDVQAENAASPAVSPAPQGTHPESGQAMHPDAPQGAPAGKGPPPPEASRSTHGSGGQHRG